jgi:AAHS family 4-hydroxybenzoate transporter-like MFS transporter
MTLAAPATGGITELIDRQKIGGFQLVVLGLCLLIQFVDGFDWQMMAYVAPALQADWGLARSTLGIVFATGVAGITAGTILIGPLADRIGRKPVILCSVALFGAVSLATALSSELWHLMALRFVAGLGLGGAVPSTIVLLTEYAPARRRTTMVTMAACGFAIGAAIGGLVAAQLIPAFGWRSMFVVGGALPLLLVAALALWLPDSVRFLMLRRPGTPAIARILRRLLPGQSDFTGIGPGAESHTARRIADLFRGRMALLTTLLWATFFLDLVVMNFLNSWLPSIGQMAGLAPPQALRAATLLQFGGMVGIVGLGALTDLFGFHRVLGSAFAASTLAIIAIPHVIFGAASAGAIFFVTGMCVIGTAQLLNAFAASLYPTAIRSTGTSWALGFGRLGSTLGPLLGGVLLSTQWPLSSVFAIAALPTALGLGTIVALHFAGSPRLARQPAE